MGNVMTWPPLEVKVWGDWACFTRPEMKVERVSYPVMTPSAARGVLESIFWKPEFTWRVEEIRVLNPIKYFSILRNETYGYISIRTVQGWARNGGGYSAPDDRTPRHTLALRDVAYIIRAQAVPTSGAGEDIAKYRDQFRRRVSRGQCFATPYLGCREFSAFFSAPDGTEHGIPTDADIGRMLLDLDFKPGTDGKRLPVFFHAEIRQGVMRVPARLQEVPDAV